MLVQHVAKVTYVSEFLSFLICEMEIISSASWFVGRIKLHNKSSVLSFIE